MDKKCTKSKLKINLTAFYYTMRATVVRVKQDFNMLMK